MRQESRFGLTVVTVTLLVLVTPAIADEIRYYHTDILGNVVAVTDENANVVERRVYEPFGLPSSPVADGPGFTGHDMDGDTGLIYMQQRYYDPLIGQFLSPDSMAVSSQTAWNFNRFNYAANNPYRFTDPDGREVNGQYHEVVAGQYHLSVRVTPDNQNAYANDSRFLTDPTSGERYVTFGAGPVATGATTIATPLLAVSVPAALALVSEINRPADADRSTHPRSNDLPVAVPAQYQNEDQFIDALFSADGNYQDNAPYGITDGDGYSSNSFTNGLLEATGAEPLQAPVSTPLSDKPVPKGRFER